jgi:hypothetical protein
MPRTPPATASGSGTWGSCANTASNGRTCTCFRQPGRQFPGCQRQPIQRGLPDHRAEQGLRRHRGARQRRAAERPRGHDSAARRRRPQFPATTFGQQTVGGPLKGLRHAGLQPARNRSCRTSSFRPKTAYPPSRPGARGSAQRPDRHPGTCAPRTCRSTRPASIRIPSSARRDAARRSETRWVWCRDAGRAAGAARQRGRLHQRHPAQRPAVHAGRRVRTGSRPPSRHCRRRGGRRQPGAGSGCPIWPGGRTCSG